MMPYPALLRLCGVFCCRRCQELCLLHAAYPLIERLKLSGHHLFPPGGFLRGINSSPFIMV